MKILPYPSLLGDLNKILSSEDLPQMSLDNKDAMVASADMDSESKFD